MILAALALVGAYLGLLYGAYVTVDSLYSALVGFGLFGAGVLVALVVDRALALRRWRLDRAGLPRVTVERLQKRAKAELGAERRRQQMRVIRGGRS